MTWDKAETIGNELFAVLQQRENKDVTGSSLTQIVQKWAGDTIKPPSMAEEKK
jgi:hypothetical protein